MLLIAAGVIFQFMVIYLVFSAGVLPFLAKRSSIPSASENQAQVVAQTFLRQVAKERFNFACTQVLLPGLLNPCMKDLKARDLHEVYQAGDRIEVVRVKYDASVATVLGKDTRPTLGEDFQLTLKLTQGRWLVRSLNGKRIAGSP